MKKLLLSLPVLLGSIWAGTSYYSGQKIEGFYEASLAELTRSSGVKWEKASYTAGLLNSSAITVVRIPGTYQEDSIFRLQHDIRHTPIAVVDGKPWAGVAAVKTTLLKEESYSDEMRVILESFVSDDPLLINTEVKFDRSSTSDVVIAEALLDSAEQKLSLAESTFQVKVDGDNVKIKGSFGDLTANNAGQETIRISGSHLDADLQRAAKGIYTGKSDFTLESLIIATPQAPHFEVKSSGVNYVSTIDNNKLTSGLTYFIKELDSPFPVNAMTLDMVSRGTSVDRWAEFSEVYEDALNSDSGSIDIPQLVRAGLNLLEPESGLNVKLALTNDGGVANTSLNLDVVPASSDYYPDNGVSTKLTLRELFLLFTAKLSIKADAAAVNLTPLAAILQSPIAQQYVVSDESTHSLNMSLDALLLTINGNSIPLEPMIPISLDMPIETLLGAP